jgi:hypothetical protein
MLDVRLIDHRLLDILYLLYQVMNSLDLFELELLESLGDQSTHFQKTEAKSISF